MVEHERMPLCPPLVRIFRESGSRKVTAMTRARRATAVLCAAALFVPPTSTPGRAAPPPDHGLEEVRLADASSAKPALLTARDSARFSLLGVTWAPRSGAGVLAQVRVRSATGWTGWQTLPVDESHGPQESQPSGRDGTEPLWVGEADGVEARVSSTDGGPVRDVRVSLIDPGTASARMAVAAVAARPPVVNRAAWGADESLRRVNPGCTVPRYSATIRTAFVHHTAGSNSYTSAQSAGLVRAIYAYHVRGRGWCDIGYSFLVDRFGRIFEGRYGGITLPVIGAHTGGYNTDSFGVSLMGTFTSTTPTAAMMEATARVIAWKLDGNYRSPHGTAVLAGKRFNVIAGHRDAKATDCPGARVYSRLPWLRSRVWALMGQSIRTPIYDRAIALGGFARVGQPYYLEHLVTGGSGTWFTYRDIYWSSGTGAHSVFGSFRTLHRRLGNGGGVIGLPAAEQHAGRRAGSQVQDFRRSGVRRALYWSSATGAHEVLDAIYAKYAAIGAESSSLGLPTTGQVGTHVVSGRANLFQHGRMYYGPATGTHPVIGVFNNAYVQPGVYTRLGLPRTDHYAVTVGLAQDFTGGRITWNATTNRTTVTYT
jgi:N-acetylmuramoyl-L-alanine amidase-like protein/LGFP repeat-containing protein